MTTQTDAFNRANEAPIAAPWATAIGGGANLTSNALTSVAAATRASYYTGTWGADQESYGTVGAVTSSNAYAEVFVRLDAAGNGFGFYTDGASGAGHTAFASYTAGAETEIGAIATTFAAGNKMRLTVSGTAPNIVLTAYKDTGGGWVQVGQLTGQSGAASGAPGAGAYGVATIDDWTGTDGAGGGSPTITATSSASPRNRSVFTVTGTAFGATQGTQELRVGGVTQTVLSWSDTSIVVADLARGATKNGVAVNVEIWNTTLQSNSFALTGFLPQLGWSYVNISSIAGTGGLVASPAIAAGDQVEYEDPAVVAADSTWDAPGWLPGFQFRVWDSGGGGWGASGLQSILKTTLGQFDRHLLLKAWW